MKRAEREFLAACELAARGTLTEADIDRIRQMSGFSAEVRLELVVDGRTLDVEQVGPRSCLLAEPIDLPPGEAEVVMHVDGERRTWRVKLPRGISRLSKRVVFE